MAKDYAALFATGNDSVALEQKIYIKEEVTRGVLALPGNSDLMLANPGATVNFTQPIESSPVRSDRHHTNVIKAKTSTEWTLPSFFHVDSTLGAVDNAEIDQAYRTLFKSMMGKEVATPPLVYTAATPPDITFSIFNVGDQWSFQAPGSFVEAANIQLPGDGDATVEFSGMSKTALLVGIGQSVADNNAGQTITLGAGQGERFPVGAKVMLIEGDGVTRSADTAALSARTVTLVAGDVVTLDGAALADADGSGGVGLELYLVYFEPDAPVAINDPQTGLQESVTIVGQTFDCVRSIGISMTNNHEPASFCYGEEGLASPFFTPGGRYTAEISLELNLNHQLVEFLNSLKGFTGEDITVVLGDATGRHVQFEMPKVIFAIPEVTPPDTGTIPVTFTGNAYQTTLDAADEVTISFL